MVGWSAAPRSCQGLRHPVNSRERLGVRHWCHSVAADQHVAAAALLPQAGSHKTHDCINIESVSYRLSLRFSDMRLVPPSPHRPPAHPVLLRLAVPSNGVKVLMRTGGRGRRQGILLEWHYTKARNIWSCFQPVTPDKGRHTPATRYSLYFLSPTPPPSTLAAEERTDG